MAILCLVFSCTNKNNPPEKTGSLFISFQSSPSAIVDMPVTLSSIGFINQEGQNITVQIDKALQLAWLDPQFISAIDLPQGQYDEMIFTLNMKNNPVTLYETAAETWLEAQVIDHNNQLVSQLSRPIQIKQMLKQPLIILDHHDAFIRLTLDMNTALKPAILSESLLQFTPIFQVDMPTTLMIEGYVIESPTPNHLIVAIGNRYLQVNNVISQLNHIDQHKKKNLLLNAIPSPKITLSRAFI